ncbi:hypothetical protein FPANT_5014 [Fusarium pseudoanthophilum]|uniref:DUF7735 domain-containing protein n=1 Tax=Fusarium pseudoanthophilum TaxID=48495 RepID=A0A8H5PC74_9HYPO|nr:hypothetical protein FPANT_5014 [Fusarium pseudoanthophilum]
MKIHAALALLQASGVAASIFDTLFPSEKPSVTRDPRECLFSDFEPYWSAVTPTGKLSTALVSYGDALQKDCKWTSFDVVGVPTCPYPALSDWCSFSDAVPATLLPEWSSYGSSASSWWEQHKKDIVSDAHMCPKRWFNQMVGIPYAYLRLNNTITFGACYARAKAHVEANPTKQLIAPETPKPTAENGHKVTSTRPEATSTLGMGAPKNTENSAQALSVNLWIMLGTILTAAA